MDVDTRHLRALVAVIDEGTFTDAAIDLGVSQASVSRSVQRIEQVLGVRLLSRTSRYVVPTSEGRQVLVRARRVLAAVDELQSVASGGGQRLLLGYAWAALGAHTVTVQRAWERGGHGDLVLVQTNTPTAGLLEGRCEVSIVRLPVQDPRLDSVRVGEERRYAALAADHPLAQDDRVRLADFTKEVIAVDGRTGTTSRGLWPEHERPTFRVTHGIDEWLTLIAAGQAVGISAEGTTAQHPRPGVTYRLLEDAPSISVWLAWWRNDPPQSLDALAELSRAAYASVHA